MAESRPEIKALIIDDEELVVTFLANVMKAIGVQPVTAGDGDAGWDVYIRENPNIVFCDVYMPGMNGLMLMSKMKERSKDTPVVLLTSFQHYKQIMEQSKVRPDKFLEKPLEIKDILRTMLEYFPHLRSEQK